MYLLVVAALEKASVWRVGDIQRHLDVLFTGLAKDRDNTLGLWVWMDVTRMRSSASREVEGSLELKQTKIRPAARCQRDRDHGMVGLS